MCEKGKTPKKMLKSWWNF